MPSLLYLTLNDWPWQGIIRCPSWKIEWKWNVFFTKGIFGRMPLRYLLPKDLVQDWSADISTFRNNIFYFHSLKGNGNKNQIAKKSATQISCVEVSSLIYEAVIMKTDWCLVCRSATYKVFRKQKATNRS